MVRCKIGRSWMAIRDMDIAAEIIGIRPLTAKLSAFAISSFYIGIAGAIWAFIYTRARSRRWPSRSTSPSRSCS